MKAKERAVLHDIIIDLRKIYWYQNNKAVFYTADIPDLKVSITRLYDLLYGQHHTVKDIYNDTQHTVIK